jgi:outer membrane receptor protein involved in Fe transport
MLVARCHRNVWLIGMTVLLMLGAAAYGNNDQRWFDIEAGDAEATLRLVALQGEIEILVDADAPTRIRTNSVRGRFTIQQALERMFSATPLVAVPVSHGNAYGIISRNKQEGRLLNPPQDPNSGPHATSNPDPEVNPNPPKPAALRGLLSTLLLGAVHVSSGQDVADDEKVLELSPFTVNASDDTGYSATSTLAGTRIRTDLKDLGSAISVYTSEFLDDIGATDAGTLLSYTSNTEVGGTQGNFSGASDAGDGRFIQAEARTNPQFNQRIRGLGQGDLTRSFFLTDIPFDSFNTDRVEVSRGPNSLLFGIGSPGGVINNSTKQAIHGENFGEARIRVDNFGSVRTELDFNRTIIDGRMALRLAALEENQKFKQKPTFEDETRFYGALDIVLLKNEKSDFLDATKLRINSETGSVKSSPVEILPPTIAYDGWFESTPASIQQYSGIAPPKNVISPSEGGSWVFQETYNPFQRTTESQINTNVHPSIFRHIGIVYSDPNAAVPNLGTNDGLQGYAGLIPWNTGRGDTLGRTGLFGTAGVAGLPATTPRASTTEYHTNSPYSEPFAIGFAAHTLQNPDVFDYRNLIYSGGIDRVARDFDALNIAVEQTFLDNRFAIELAYDKQHYETDQDFFFTGGNGTSSSGPYDIYVSIAEYLLNGQPNPNLGRAYTRVARPETRFSESDRETFRVTSFASFDFTEKENFLRHLGRHRLTGLYTDYTQDTHNLNWRESWGSDEFDIGAANSGFTLNHARRPVNALVYTSGSLLGLTSMDDVRLQQINIPRPQPGDAYNVFYADVNSTFPKSERTLKTGNVYVQRYLDSENLSRTEIEAQAIAWQSYLFDNHLVGLLGYRTDDTKSYGRQNVTERGIEDRLADGSYDPNFALLSEIPSLDESGDTVTWSVVGRFPENLLFKLPEGMELQAQYAASENFNPIGLRNNALGESIGQPTGTTKEYGFLASFAHNKFSIRLNWFETALNDVNASPNVNVASEIGGRINSYRDAEINGQPFSWQLQTVSGDPAAFPVQDYATFYNRMDATFPPNLRAVVNPRQVDTDGDGVWDRVEFDAIPSLRSIQDRVSEGFEVEMVASPNPGWRMLANLSQQQSVQSNTAAVMSQVVESYNQALQSSRLGELNRSPDGTVQVRSINEIWLIDGIAPIRAATALDNTVANEQREWRFSGVSTYRFMEGRLKGISVGGAVRWEDEAATGYVFQLEPDTGVPVPDVTKPFFDEGLFSGDMWFGYEKKLWDGKLDWKIQFNIRNLLGETSDIPVKTNPDGQTAVVRIPNPRTISITNSFRF